MRRLFFRNAPYPRRIRGGVPTGRSGSPASSTRRIAAGIDMRPLPSTRCGYSPEKLTCVCPSFLVCRISGRKIVATCAGNTFSGVRHWSGCGRRQMWKWRTHAAATAWSTISARFRDIPTARATWGDVCSPARRIFRTLVNGTACMKSAIFLFLFRVTDLSSVCSVLVSFVVSFRALLVSWEMPPRKGILWEWQGVHVSLRK